MKQNYIILFLLLIVVSGFKSKSISYIKNSENTIVVQQNYPVFYKFQFILNDEKYKCYGKPCDYYKTKRCSLCNKEYYYQKFCNGSYSTTFYSDTDCTISKTKKHDNLKLKTAEPCGCNDSFDIGIKF